MSRDCSATTARSPAISSVTDWDGAAAGAGAVTELATRAGVSSNNEKLSSEVAVARWDLLPLAPRPFSVPMNLSWHTRSECAELPQPKQRPFIAPRKSERVFPLGPARSSRVLVASTSMAKGSEWEDPERGVSGW